MKYNALVLDHFHNPRCLGSFARDEAGVLTAKVGDYNRGDIIQLQVRCSTLGLIEAACFKAYGSVATIAAGSYTAQWLVGKVLSQVQQQFSGLKLMQALQLPQIKLHCALLAEDAVRSLSLPQTSL